MIHKLLKTDPTTNVRNSYVWEVIKILLWDTTKVGTDQYLSTKIYLGIYMLMTSFLINNYLCQFTSFITLTPYKWKPINSLEDLLKSDLKWLVRDSNTIINYYKDNQIMSRKRVRIDSNNIFNSVVYAMQKIHDNPNMYAYIMAEVAVKGVTALKFADLDGNHEFHYGKKPVREISTMFYLPKHAVYNKDLTLKLLKLTQNGILQYLKRKSLEDFYINARKMAKKENRKPKTYVKEGVHMKHMTGCFIFIGIGYVLSVLVLGGEILHCIIRLYCVTLYYFTYNL